MMKFNQKIYLIPAAKYEKLLVEKNQKQIQAQASESRENSSSFISSPNERSHFPIKSTETTFTDTENTVQKVNTTPDTNIEKNSIYSQVIKENDKNSEKNQKKSSERTFSELSNAKFPPPGEPDKAKLARNLEISTKEPVKKKLKLDNTPKTKNTKRWVNLK